MRIRDADPSLDAAACATIYRPYVVHSATSFEEDPPDGAEMARRITGVQRTHPWLVGERDGAITGFAYASAHRNRSAYRWAADVSVYIAAAYHRQGVGSALYEALFERLREQGFLIACAGITIPNPASVALHESLGFELIGVYRRIGYKQGAWHDVGWWQLALGEQTAPPAEPRPPGA
jgi:phosphinothricin acetyltransferase